MKIFMLLTFMGFTISNNSICREPRVLEIHKLLSEISNQYGDTFDHKTIPDEITLICVEGTNNAFAEIFSKFKYYTLDDNVQVVAGWKDVMPDIPDDKKLNHINAGFTSDQGLGKEAYPILMDVNSKFFNLLNLNKYSIVRVSMNQNKVEITDFGSDRIEFLKEVKKYFNLTN
jgi:hypothetical protein